MGAGKSALGQLLLIAAILWCCVLYTRNHVSSLQRADFSQQEYVEDSKAGDGTRYRVLARASDTAGQSFTVEVLARAGIRGFLPDLSASSPEHSHTQGQEEEVTVIKGRLGYLLGRNSSSGELAAGETLTIPAGRIHALFNADNGSDLLYTLSHRPAGAMGEAFFENLAGLGWDYGSLDRIHPLQVLVLYHDAGTQLSDLTGLIAPLVDKVLLPVAHFLGFKADYPSHRSKGPQIRTTSSSSGSSAGSGGDGSSGGSHEEL